MFIDISTNHTTGIMNDIDVDSAEHYGYADEFFALDLRDEAQALYAIRTWLLPGTEYWTPTGRYQRREACRFALMLGHGFGCGRCWLPGIDTMPDVGPVSEALGTRAFRRFHFLVWQELFPEEPFRPRPLSVYRQRVDHGFDAHPDWPADWGTPQYKPWPPHILAPARFLHP
ncbi:hypothetical protein SAMN05216359_106221 [Roseateles sp. YR242]|uniref:hypothetical protein n=1 Tax=Roseateles sp. YR242 TaxID=1855305 RepID=UPI0008C2B3BD|nr:hypothetical protein [Roseateles sp. YR242]SEL22500.1 hypothetical protein SAMN05216359_106221 [Roseateles sp. YR242]